MKLKADATATIIPAVLKYSFRNPSDVCIAVIGAGESSHINP